MPDLNTAELVTESLARRLDGLESPTPDLAAVTGHGRSLRRRRTGLVATAGLAAAACGAVIAGQAMIGGPGGSAQAYAPLGALDLSNGLRAYSTNDGSIYMAGRTFDEGDVHYLDTSAATVPAGVVFFDSKLRPHLLDESGTVSRLGDGSTAGLKEFRPTASADVNSNIVGWTLRHEGRAQVVLYDADAREQVATRDVPCQGEACDAVKLDGLDGDLAFVRTAEGTFTWDRSDDSWTKVAGPETRIADVHNGVLLHDGPAPNAVGPLAEGWRFVKGPIDAQLTFDGKYVLNWSSTLKSTTPGGPDLKLDLPVPGEGFYTVDTDGSILVAMMGSDGYTQAEPPAYHPELEPSGKGPGARVDREELRITDAVPDLPRAGDSKTTFFDCEVPSGTCTKLGEHEVNGDPMFIGNDM